MGTHGLECSDQEERTGFLVEKVCARPSEEPLQPRELEEDSGTLPRAACCVGQEGARAAGQSSWGWALGSGACLRQNRSDVPWAWVPLPGPSGKGGPASVGGKFSGWAWQFLPRKGVHVTQEDQHRCLEIQADSSCCCPGQCPPPRQPPQAKPCALQVPAGGERQGTGPLLLQEPLLSCVPHRYAQEVSRLCLLSAGTYRIVPSTYLPDTEGSFTVTIATRVDRRSIHSQETLGQVLQEVSLTAVMKV